MRLSFWPSDLSFSTPLASLRLQFGGGLGLQLCCQRVILSGNNVASGSWERGENNQVLKAESHGSREEVGRNPAPFSQNVCHHCHEEDNAGVCTYGHKVGTQITNTATETADWDIFGDYLWERFVFSCAALLSHVLKDAGPLKKKHAAYFEASSYQVTMLQNIS